MWAFLIGIIWMVIGIILWNCFQSRLNTHMTWLPYLFIPLWPIGLVYWLVVETILDEGGW